MKKILATGVAFAILGIMGTVSADIPGRDPMIGDTTWQEVQSYMRSEKESKNQRIDAYNKATTIIVGTKNGQNFRVMIPTEPFLVKSAYNKKSSTQVYSIVGKISSGGGYYQLQIHQNTPVDVKMAREGKETFEGSPYVALSDKDITELIQKNPTIWREEAQSARGGKLVKDGVLAPTWDAMVHMPDYAYTGNVTYNNQPEYRYTVGTIVPARDDKSQSLYQLANFVIPSLRQASPALEGTVPIRLGDVTIPLPTDLIQYEFIYDRNGKRLPSNDNFRMFYDNFVQVGMFKIPYPSSWIGRIGKNDILYDSVQSYLKVPVRPTESAIRNSWVYVNGQAGFYIERHIIRDEEEKLLLRMLVPGDTGMYKLDITLPVNTPNEAVQLWRDRLQSYEVQRIEREPMFSLFVYDEGIKKELDKRSQSKEKNIK